MTGPQIFPWGILIVLCCVIAPGRAQEAGGYLGIHARSNSNVLDAQNALTGITVTRVVENSPAEAAGIKENDIVLQANGRDISDPNQLTGLVGSLPPGSEIELSIERDREVKTLKARTVPRIPPPPDAPPGEPKKWIENKRLGFEFKPPGEGAGKSAGVDPGTGLEVTRAAASSPIIRAGIEPGAIIEKLDGEPILGADTFLQAIKDKDEERSVRLTFTNPDGREKTRKVVLHRAPNKTKKFNLPPFVMFTRKENTSTLSIPILLFRRDRLENATRYKWLWIFKFERGASEELLEVEPLD